jgi:hypothetical protein
MLYSRAKKLESYLLLTEPELYNRIFCSDADILHLHCSEF